MLVFLILLLLLVFLSLFVLLPHTSIESTESTVVLLLILLSLTHAFENLAGWALLASIGLLVVPARTEALLADVLVARSAGVVLSSYALLISRPTLSSAFLARWLSHNGVGVSRSISDLMGLREERRGEARAWHTRSTRVSWHGRNNLGDTPWISRGARRRDVPCSWDSRNEGSSGSSGGWRSYHTRLSRNKSSSWCRGHGCRRHLLHGQAGCRIDGHHREASSWVNRRGLHSNTSSGIDVLLSSRTLGIRVGNVAGSNLSRKDSARGILVSFSRRSRGGSGNK